MTAREYNNREILAGRLTSEQVAFLASRSPQDASDSLARVEGGARVFQATTGLVVDGKAGPATRRAVDRAIAQQGTLQLKAFPVKIPKGFMPRRIVVRQGRKCKGQEAPFKPLWGGGMLAPRGPSRSPHNALDIMCAVGALICAVDDGEVMTTWRYQGTNRPGAGHSSKGGWYVRLRHSWGTSYYAHLDEEPLVRPGQRVKAGEVLGYAGTSGNATGGCPHLHIGLQDNHGKPVDPKLLLEARYEAGEWLLG